MTFLDVKDNLSISLGEIFGEKNDALERCKWITKEALKEAVYSVVFIASQCSGESSEKIIMEFIRIDRFFSDVEDKKLTFNELKQIIEKNVESLKKGDVSIGFPIAKLLSKPTYLKEINSEQVLSSIKHILIVVFEVIVKASDTSDRGVSELMNWFSNYLSGKELLTSRPSILQLESITDRKSSDTSQIFSKNELGSSIDVNQTGLARMVLELKEVNNVLSTEVTSLREKSLALAAENNDLKAQIPKKNDEIFFLQKSVDALQANNTVMSEKLKSIEDEIKRIENETLLMQQKYFIQSEDLLRLREENSKLLRTLIGYKSRISPEERTSSEVEDYDDLISSLVVKSNELQSELSVLIEEKRALQLEFSVGRERYIKFKTDLDTLEETLELRSYGVYPTHFNFDTSEKLLLALEALRLRLTKMIKDKAAAVCETKWTINGDAAEGRKQTQHYIKIMLRAFNGECATFVSNVRWNNASTMENRIRRSYEKINELGRTHNISIVQEYLDLKIDELRLCYEYREKIHEEKEELRRIRELEKEEERSIKEMEAARQEAEKEEARYLKALSIAQGELNQKFGAEREALQLKIEELKKNLENVKDLKERAISMAQITKAGHIYIISNIGSFGNNVYKIGMTRRLDPSDRVRELGGASVPFEFDIHGLIYSNNAPELENKFHRRFKNQRINWISGRKEFFQVTLDELCEYARELGCEIDVVKVPEAKSYRETLARKEMYSQGELAVDLFENIPLNLFDSEVDNEEEFLEGERNSELSGLTELLKDDE